MRYLLRTPIKALDICFKSHFALDAAYLIPCKTVFYFIQQYFFDIYLKGDDKIQRVTADISSLKGLGQKQNNHQNVLCSECGLVIPTISGLCSHLKIIHRFDVLNTFKCGQNGCDRKYGTMKSFLKHLNRDHPIPIQDQEFDGVKEIDLDNPERDVANVLPDADDNKQQNEVDIDYAPITPAILRNTLFNSSLSLSAKLYSSNSLNRSQIQDVIDYIHEYSSSGYLEVLISKVCLMLRNTNQREEDVHELNDMFIAQQNSFFGLETEYLRMKALEANDCYIRPISYIIGPGEKIKNINGQAIVTPVDLTGQHIPMQQVLKSFFQLPGVLETTLNNIASLKNSRTFTNIIQSPLWRL